MNLVHNQLSPTMKLSIFNISKDFMNQNHMVGLEKMTQEVRGEKTTLWPREAGC